MEKSSLAVGFKAFLSVLYDKMVNKILYLYCHKAPKTLHFSGNKKLALGS